MALRDLKIGTKQGVGFGVILVVMAGVSIFAIIQMATLHQEIDDLNEVWLQRTILTSRVNLNASALRATQLQHAFETRRAQKEAYVDTMLFLIDKVDEDRDAYSRLMEESAQRNLVSEEQSRLTAGLDSLWDVYLAHSLDYLDLRGRDAVAVLSGEAGRVFSIFSTHLAELARLNEASAAEAARRAEATYTTTRNRIILLLVVTILLSGVIAVWLVRFITIPVRQLVKAARKVADGDFNVRLDSASKDEIGTLTRSFSSMTRSLKTQQEDLRTKNQDLEQALHRLKDTQQQLILKEKMASLGQLTAGIAHEIKNPLNFVNNFAQLSVELADELADELESNKEQTVASVLGEVEELLGDLRLNAQKIRDHGQRADSIVQGMLEHSRGHAGERRPLAINGLVDEYVNLAYHGMRARQADFNATLERDYDEAVGTIELAPQEMGRVLLNLLNNAFYAVYERRLAGDGTFEPSVRVSTRALGNTVEIRVEDNGGGIPEAIRDRIFEPFFTTKPTGSGNTGLGLSLSYEIVTQGHGGTLSVESEEGQGATFVVTLPAQPG
ncbi:MAG: ATP-binding protein [Rhodothermales bacterium]